MTAITPFIDLHNNNQYTFLPKDIFLVYIRRSNGKSKPIYTGLIPSKAFELYHSLKIFKNDRKYLMIKREGRESKIYSLAGTDEKIKSHLGYKIKPNFEQKLLQNITGTPVTCFTTFKAMAETHQNMSVNKLIPLLICNFISLTHNDQIGLINSSLEIISKHKILSGGDNSRDILSALEKMQNDDDQDLL
jgi:hypothetical protein